ncbi:MAG: leucyl/phenylalanyl-tRNA--protein transferase [Beijerinckiaceae bacterium]
MSRGNQKSQTITPATILRAYAAGIFPMANSADDEDLFWVEPEQRGIFPLDAITVSRSLAKAVRQNRFCVHVDRNFDAVIDACAQARQDRPTTWINGRIRELYGALFRMGHVHTVECYDGEMLAGGLYGVSIGGAFFGESMFHRATDASKIALVHLAARLRLGGYALLDAQFVTEHLATLGAIEIPRDAYRALLSTAVSSEADFTLAGRTAPLTGVEALEALKGSPPANGQTA